PWDTSVAACLGLLLSSSNTRRRARTRLSAALSPTGPAPTMTTSYSASPVPVIVVLSSQPISQTLHAGDRRILAEQLHRLEQRRADAAARQRSAQRTERNARLEP